MGNDSSQSDAKAAARSSRPVANRLREVSVDFEIPFHDVDALQIVWHGHYYKYFELARTALLRGCKLDGPEVRDLGHGMLVIESQCRHIAPLTYGDQARVTAWLADVVHRIHVQFEIQNLTRGRRAARGHTMLVATTGSGEMLHRTPDALVARLLGDAAPKR
jgi:acyl-CoA thioester hydrolase